MKACTLVLTLLLAITVRAEDGKKHPIDRKMDAASEKANSTHDMIQLQVQGQKLWDDELNRVYAQLKKKLKPSAFASLQTAQRDWLKYRDSQIAFISEYYTQFEGTMYQPMREAAILEVTRARALELTHLLEMLDE